MNRKADDPVDPNSHHEELLHRGYVFIFSSGCIVTWGYNGRDRDWIDAFVQLYQCKRGWPSFDGFNLPFWVTIPLYLQYNGSWLNPREMKIARTDFLNLNWVINKKSDHFWNRKRLSNDIEAWNCQDVQHWLHSVHLDAYCPIFEHHEIDGKMLLKFAANSPGGSSTKPGGSSLTNNSQTVFIEKVWSLKMSKDSEKCLVRCLGVGCAYSSN